MERLFCLLLFSALLFSTASAGNPEAFEPHKYDIPDIAEAFIPFENLEDETSLDSELKMSQEETLVYEEGRRSQREMFEKDYSMVMNAFDASYKAPVAEYENMLALYAPETETDIVLTNRDNNLTILSTDRTTGVAKATPLVAKQSLTGKRLLLVSRSSVNSLTLDKSLDELDIDSIGVYLTVGGGITKIHNTEHPVTFVSYGDHRDVLIFAGEQNRLVDTGPGDDIIIGSFSANPYEVKDALPASKRSCTIYFCSRPWYNVISGGSGNDILDGTNSQDELHGGPGNDYVRGFASCDWVYGDQGNDRHVNGNTDGDVVQGGDGDDYVYGGQGVDHVVGNPGYDRTYGDNDNDMCWGEVKSSSCECTGPDITYTYY